MSGVFYLICQITADTENQRPFKVFGPLPRESPPSLGWQASTASVLPENYAGKKLELTTAEPPS